eukprot:4890246-Ditylum_brightwellii.AAC.1
MDASPLECGIILTAFAARVQTGFYGQGGKVHISSVAEALAFISKTCKLDGQQSPVYKAGTTNTYILPVQ